MLPKTLFITLAGILIWYPLNQCFYWLYVLRCSSSYLLLSLFLFHILRWKCHFISITIGLDDFAFVKNKKKMETFTKSSTFSIHFFWYHFPQYPVPAFWWSLPWQIKKSSCCQRNSLFLASVIWNNFFTFLHLINSPYWLFLELHISCKSRFFSLVCIFIPLSFCSLLVLQSLIV